MSLLSKGANLPKIALLIDVEEESVSTHLYSQSIRHLLRRILDDQDELLEDPFPIVRWTETQDERAPLSVFLLCYSRPNAARFFHEMLSRWLIPGKRLDFGLFFSADFQLAGVEELCTVAEATIACSNSKERAAMLQNLPILAMEIRLGVVSAFHARRILEIKGLSTDEKTSVIQESIASLVHKRPQHFDYDIFSEMQHFLVNCRNEFKAVRECQQMSRIIYLFYLFRKALHAQMEALPGKRHLSLRLAKTRLHLPFGIKQVLSLFVGINFLKDNEVFEESHLIAALRHYIPNVVPVEDSFFVSESREDTVHLVYLEIEKEDGAPFTLEEQEQLRRELPEDLKASVEQLMRPVFMPRNEEEVMRNILILAKQLKYTRDIPQMIISFNEQVDADLSFTVVFVRLLLDDSPTVGEILQRTNAFKFSIERVKKMGMVRNKYPKEATVFRARFPMADFLRQDQSVDLYKARQKLIEELQGIFGQLRDYNGGMIAKQIESFATLNQLLGDIALRHEFLLENFFHSIFPVEKRSVLSPVLLKDFFLLLLEILEEKASIKLRTEKECVFALLNLSEEVEEEPIAKLNLNPSELISLHLKAFDTYFLGYVYFCDDPNRQKIFRDAIDIQSLTFDL